jgi:hypothetical protein
MSQPSARKQRKQKDRERRIAKKKHEALEQRVYDRKFPAFEIEENDADDGFVNLIRRTLRDIDFRDRTLFHPKETEFLKLVKKEPGDVIPALVQGVHKRNLSALHLVSMVGHRVFTRIGPDRLRQWIPYHDVQFLLAGEKIVVRFRSLERAKGSGGTIYYSPLRPQIEIDGKKLIVGWSRHAIERTCERLAPRWDSYLGLGDVFALFHDCRRFETCQLHAGRQVGFTLFDACAQGYFSGHIAEKVLGRGIEKHCYYRVGYCPVVMEGDFAKATTLLYPGFCGTPEYGLILQAGFGREERQKLISTASGMSRAVLEQTQDTSLMKWFHDNGVPQIIETDEDYFGRKRKKVRQVWAVTPA